MSLKSASGAWRGFSLVKEAAYGTPQTVDTSLNFTGEPVDTEPDKIYVNDDEFSGELAPTKQQIITTKFEGKHAQKAMPHNVALFLSLLTGKVTTTDPSDPLQATVRHHKISTDKAEILIPSRTMREYDGADCLEFAGVVCSEAEISGARKDFCEMSASILGMGKEEVITPTPSRPAQAAESYLKYGDVNINIGGSYDGTDVAGGSAIHARARDFKINIKNNAHLDHLFGDPSGYAGRARRGRSYDIGVEMSLEFEDRSEKTALLASTENVLEIPIVGALIGSSTTNKFTVRFVFPSVRYNKAKKAVDDGLLLLGAGFSIFADPTYGPLDVFIINEQTQYL